MKYITQEQLDAFMNDRSLSALSDGLDETLLGQINDKAVAKIDGYLRGVYDLPLTEPVDNMLLTLCGDLMRYYLYERRGAANMPDKILELYRMTIKDLEKIQNRTIVLAVTDETTGESAPADLESIQVHTPTQQFKEKFTGFNND